MRFQKPPTLTKTEMLLYVALCGVVTWWLW